MYIMIAVIGSCLTGARATSHAFLSFNVSISAGVRGARTAVFEEPCCFCEPMSTTHLERARESYLASCRRRRESRRVWNSTRLWLCGRGRTEVNDPLRRGWRRCHLCSLLKGQKPNVLKGKRLNGRHGVRRLRSRTGFSRSAVFCWVHVVNLL